MRKVIVNEFMSLDGVVQAPGAADEDISGGFEHAAGTCATSTTSRRSKYSRASSRRAASCSGAARTRSSRPPGRTPEEEQVIAEPLNTKPKYVASTTLTEPLEWQSSTPLQGDVAEAVAALRQENGGDVHVIRSSVLVQTLIGHDLVDESGS
jgi:hypothetical protein